jgi:cation transport ATPase
MTGFRGNSQPGRGHRLTLAELPLVAMLLAGGIPLVGDLVGQRRAGPFLAVLVVATPCPLLIAIPVAIIGRIGWPMALPQRSSG